jgi:asparagine synthase (glutamine-hydrolysing)
MSGIAGIWHLDGRPVDPAGFEKMMDVIRYRGPDGSGSYSGGSVMLGHQQLCTTPESLDERQPLRSADGMLCLTADARVDNRAELRRDLEAHGFTPRTETDAELILGAYEVWSEDCPLHILGDFAFALWDGRRRQLFCARDPIGARMLYYHHDARSFRFASVASALLADGEIRREPNLTLMQLYLLGKHNPHESLFKGISRLPPAQRLVLRDGSRHTGRYWDPTPKTTIRYKSDEEYAEHFRALFGESVRARLRSHRPVGSTLSGGLDSSSVVCMAQKLMGEGNAAAPGFESYSLVYDGLPCDERPYIEDVLRVSGVRGHLFPFEEIRPWLDFERTESMVDVPHSPNLTSQAPLLQAAQQRGMRTMLTGLGGDDLLTHRRAHLTELWQQLEWRRLWRQLRQDAVDLNTSTFALFYEHCLKRSVPGWVKRCVRTIRGRSRGRLVPDWLNSNLLYQKHIEEQLALPLRNGRSSTASQQLISNLLARGWNQDIAVADVENLGAHFDVEFRHPFYDRRLMEFCVALPWEQRYLNGMAKRVLRIALADILPESIGKRRDKARFECIMRAECARQGDRYSNLLRMAELDKLGVVDGDRLRQHFEVYQRTGSRELPPTAWATLFSLELWCRWGRFCETQES